MPISMAALKQARVRLSAEYQGDTISFAYYPHKVSDEWMDKGRKLATKPDTRASIALLLDVLADWDITSDGTQSLAITTDALALVGPVIRNTLLEGITQDMFPNLKAATAD